MYIGRLAELQTYRWCTKNTGTILANGRSMYDSCTKNTVVRTVLGICYYPMLSRGEWSLSKTM